MSDIQIAKFLCKCAFIFCFPFIVQAKDYAIIYPDVREPYLSIFEQISQGVEDATIGDIYLYPLPQSASAESIAFKLNEQKLSGAILLGRRGYQLADHVLNSIPVVIGAHPVMDKKYSGISMMTDPEIGLKKLKLLVPAVKRLFLIVSEPNQWVADLTEQAVKAYHIESHITIVKDLKAAVLAYQKVIKQMNGSKDALWLPIDPHAMHDKVILPIVLKAAWEKHFVVFSSVPTHASRGVLFSFYPDNYQLGRHLAQLLVAKKQTAKWLPMSEVLLAVNLRTAGHMGISYSRQEKSQFDIVLPEQ